MAINMGFSVQPAGPVGQSALVIAIAKNIEEQGITKYNERQINSIVDAANLICAEFAKPHVPATAGMGVAAWLKCDETGLASRYMLYVLQAQLQPSELRHCGKIADDYGNPCVPHDPSDFGRCVAMLDAAPELRQYIPKLLEGSGPIWKALAEKWGELEALYREDFQTGEAPRLFAALNKIHGQNRLEEIDSETD